MNPFKGGLKTTNGPGLNGKSRLRGKPSKFYEGLAAFKDANNDNIDDDTKQTKADYDLAVAAESRKAAREAILKSPPAEMDAFDPMAWAQANQLTASLLVVAIGAGLYYSVSCHKR
jgi:hypothetical protein